PATLIRIVNRTLKKDRDERYQSAEEVVSDLKAVSRELESGVFVRAVNGSTVAPPTIAVPAPSPLRSRGRFRLWTLAAAAAALIAVYAVQHRPASDTGT